MNMDIYFYLESLRFTVFHLVFMMKISTFITHWVIREIMLHAAFWDTQRKSSISTKGPILIYSYSIESTSLVAHWTTREGISGNVTLAFKKSLCVKSFITLRQLLVLTVLFPSPSEWPELPVCITRGNWE